MRAFLFLLCFGSIWTLLGFLYGLATMHVLAAVLLVPSLVMLFAVWAQQRGEGDLHLILLVGFWGGVWGTLGYDLIRVPLHFMGMNPLAPIRSYGMFAVNAPHATLFSDGAGALYHFSNGITFAWMYALLMMRRHWAWAVLWGLVLETFAVITPFGALYGIRADPVALGIAYFAHLYYGIPLGWACADPERTRRLLRRLLPWTGAATVAVLAVLALSWERPWRGPELPESTVQIGPDALFYGWTASDGTVTLRNAAGRTIALEVPGTLEPFDLPDGASRQLLLQPGMHQLRAPQEPWRSAFIGVRP